MNEFTSLREQAGLSQLSKDALSLLLISRQCLKTSSDVRVAAPAVYDKISAE